MGVKTEPAEGQGRGLCTPGVAPGVAPGVRKLAVHSEGPREMPACPAFRLESWPQSVCPVGAGQHRAPLLPARAAPFERTGRRRYASEQGCRWRRRLWARGPSALPLCVLQLSFLLLAVSPDLLAKEGAGASRPPVGPPSWEGLAQQLDSPLWPCKWGFCCPPVRVLFVKASDFLGKKGSGAVLSSPPSPNLSSSFFYFLRSI